jgi:hypothetical protein
MNGNVSSYPDQNRSPGRLPVLAVLAFAASIVLYPFNASISVGFLGEVSSEPYVLVNLIALPLLLPLLLSRRSGGLSQPLLRMGVAFLVINLLLFAVNASDILAAFAKERSGLSRFGSGLLVPIFGFYVAQLFAMFARANVHKYVILPFIISSMIVAGAGVLEVLSWGASPFPDIYAPIAAVTHALTRRGANVVGYVSSVTAEASNFGACVIASLPVLLAVASRPGRPRLRILCALTAMVLFMLAFFSGRTSVGGAILTVVTYFGIVSLLSWRIFTSGGAIKAIKAIYLVVTALPLCLIPLFKDEIIESVLRSENISNVSRFATMAIQLDIFADNPVFGVGMGQWGFYVLKYIPSWAMEWEFRNWLYDPAASFFPSFSLSTRILAELGLVGFLVWTYFNLVLLSGTLKRIFQIKRERGQLPYIGIAIVCQLFGILYAGWNAASYKSFIIWMAFGLAAAYCAYPERIEYSVRPKVARRWSPLRPQLGAASAPVSPGPVGTGRQ